MVAEQNREKAKRRENGMKSNNQINIPQARDAMDKFKMQAASELDVPVTYLTTTFFFLKIQKTMLKCFQITL